MKKINYKLWILDFKKRGEIIIDQNYVKAIIPLGNIKNIVYFGEDRITIPINHIASVNSRYLPAWIFAILIDILSLYPILTLILAGNLDVFLIFLLLDLIVTVLMLCYSVTQVIIDTVSGRKYIIIFQFSEKNKAKKVEKLLNTAIENRTYDTNTRIVTEKQTKTIVSAINELKTSNRL